MKRQQDKARAQCLILALSTWEHRFFLLSSRCAFSIIPPYQLSCSLVIMMVEIIVMKIEAPSLNREIESWLRWHNVHGWCLQSGWSTRWWNANIFYYYYIPWWISFASHRLNTDSGGILWGLTFPWLYAVRIKISAFLVSSVGNLKQIIVVVVCSLFTYTYFPSSERVHRARNGVNMMGAHNEWQFVIHALLDVAGK